MRGQPQNRSIVNLKYLHGVFSRKLRERKPLRVVRVPDPQGGSKRWWRVRCRRGWVWAHYGNTVSSLCSEGDGRGWRIPLHLPCRPLSATRFHWFFPGHGVEQETVDRLTAGAAMSEVSGGKYFSARVSTHGFRHRQSWCEECWTCFPMPAELIKKHRVQSFVKFSCLF